MVENPIYWEQYYSGGEHEQKFARKYSLSDRSRYYWPNPKVQAALTRLLSNLKEHEVPLSLLSQALPDQYPAVRAGKIENQPIAWIEDKIELVLSDYHYACAY
jgi:D-tagatose-1,6-bisphosphate aldolase subunit GatZ/KbaZ